MKIAVIIPARYGSSRFEGKPLAAIAGKPMIQRVVECAQAGVGVDLVAVATDSPAIARAVNRFGARAVMTSERRRSGTDRVAEAADVLGLAPGDIVVNVQGDQPLLRPECLQQVVAPLTADSGVEMSTLAFRIVCQREKTDPKDVKVVFDDAGDALYFSRSLIPFGRDSADFPVYKHLGIYAYTRRFLDRFAQLPSGRLEQIEKLEQLRALENGHRIRVVLTDYDSPEVDLPEDVARIEAQLHPGSRVR